MGRPKSSIPKLCTDLDGRAFAKVSGKFITLGRADSPESRLRYAALLSDLAQGKPVEPKREPKSQPGAVSVSELCLRFLTDYALPRYKKSDGKPSAEVDCFKSVIRILGELFGETPAGEFQALRLRTVRQKMIEAGWSRRWINKQIGRLRLMFRVAASWEMIRPDVLASLETVPALTVGETTAPETEPRTAVSDADLKAVRAVLRELHRDIFDLLLLCGSRPAELINLTVGDIDRTGEIWRCDLRHHKTAKKGKSRTLFFIPAAQLILRKYLTANPDERLFPIERVSFGNAIKRACLKAGVTPFVPHQLRHTVATRLADEVGLEAAQRLLGHSQKAMTEHYSRAAERTAIDAVQRLG